MLNWISANIKKKGMRHFRRKAMRCLMQAVAIVDASCVVYCSCINVRELLPLFVLLFELVSVYFIKSFEKEFAESRKKGKKNNYE